MKKLKGKHHIIYTDKISKNYKIALLSDVHYHHTFSDERLQKIISNLQKHLPHYICLTGDIIDTTNELDDASQYKKILSFLSSLGEIAPTIIVLGNHDIIRLKKENKKTRSFFLPNLKWIRDIQKLKRVYLLENEILTISDFQFIGYFQDASYYGKKYEKESKEEMVSALKRHFKQSQFNNGFHIFLCHSPNYVLAQDFQTKIPFWKEIDLTLSGHMHRGCMPHPLSSILLSFSHLFPKNSKSHRFCQNGGLIGPKKQKFPIFARGRVNVCTNHLKMTAMVTDGITMFSKTSPKMFQKIDCLFSSSIDYIEIRKK